MPGEAPGPVPPWWLEWIARRVTAAVRPPRLRLALYLLAGLAVGSAALSGFVALSRIVLEGTTQVFDDWVLTWVATLRTPERTRIMLLLSALGGIAVLAPVLTAVTLILWRAQARLSVALLWTAVAGGLLLTLILKTAFGRPRPAIIPPVVPAAMASFPSGHATAALVVYAVIAVLIGRLVPGYGPRLLLWADAILISVLVGVSRIYLGVHYPSDVLAGYAIGAAWVGFVVSAFAVYRLFDEIRSR